jgi:pantothenate kinase
MSDLASVTPIAQSGAQVSACAGFHLYRAELDMMPNPEQAHARRGAAFTFNAAAFVECVKHIAADEHGVCMRVPSFDHGIGDPIEGGIVVLPQHRFVLVEGLYVLRGAASRQQPWPSCSQFVHSVATAVPFVCTWLG